VAEVGLSLLKHEAVVGPSLGRFSVEGASFIDLALCFSEDGFADQSRALA